MPTYQVPQFLDSGDKIIGPLNLRQLVYAIVGGGLLFGAYNFLITVGVNNIFALVMVAFPAFFLALLVVGKYNGRDIELYVLVMFDFIRKPKVMLYKKKPDLHELEERESHLNYAFLADSLEKRYMDSARQLNSSHSFKNQSLQIKMAKIKAISEAIDFKKRGGYDVLDQLDKQNRAFAQTVSSMSNTAMYANKKSRTVLASRGQKLKSMSEKPAEVENMAD